MYMSSETPEFETYRGTTPGSCKWPSTYPSHMYFNLASCVICVFAETQLTCLKCKKLSCLELYWNILCAFVLIADWDSKGNFLAIEEPIIPCLNWQSWVKSFLHQC